MPSKWAMERATRFYDEAIWGVHQSVESTMTRDVARLLDETLETAKAARVQDLREKETKIREEIRREALEDAAQAVLNGFDDTTAARAIRALIEKETDR